MSEMTLTGALRRRRTCRDFDGRPIADDDLEELIGVTVADEAGRHVFPSAHDRRPLRVLVAIGTGDARGAGLFAIRADGRPRCVTTSDIREEIVDAVVDRPAWLVAAPVIFAITAEEPAMLAEFATQSDDGLRGRDFIMIEAGALVQSLLLVAAARGLGAVFVGGIDQARAQRALQTRNRVVGFVAVGRPASP